MSGADQANGPVEGDLASTLAAARRLYERFLPPTPFRGFDPALYEIRFHAGPDETLVAWEAAQRWAHVEPDAAHAALLAERHLRAVSPAAVAIYDQQRGAGMAPVEAIAVVRMEVSSTSPRLPDLVGHPAPFDELLAPYLAAGDHAALCEFAEALGRHRDELWERAAAVAGDEHALATREGMGAPAPLVPPAAVAACLAAFVVESGDDIATVANGLGVDPAWARGVLTGDVTHVGLTHVEAMCTVLECSPEELLGPAGVGLQLGPNQMAAAELAPPTTTTAAQELVDAAGFLRADELLVEVDAMEPDALADFVRALATRHSQLECWSDDLAEREAAASLRLQGPGPDEVELPAAPLAAQFEMLAIDSGDDLDTVARGLGFDPAWVRGVVDGSVDVVDAHQARQLCDALDLSPAEVFGVAGVALEGPGSAWAVVPYDPFHHEAHVELLEPDAPAPLDLDFGP